MLTVVTDFPVSTYLLSCVRLLQVSTLFQGVHSDTYSFLVCLKCLRGYSGSTSMVCLLILL